MNIKGIILWRILYPIRDQIDLIRINRHLMRDMQAVKPRDHGLDMPLIVNLTSYPPRYKRLHYCLKSLLRQDVKADRVILWLAADDVAKLPANVRALEGQGLEIRACPDYRSFKKIVPALEAFPDACLVTADDDIIYEPNWLASLVDGFDRDNPTIICRRAHRIKMTPDGFAPYLEWDLTTLDAQSLQPSADLLPVGVSGVLYPPGLLHPDVTNAEAFMALCPRGDDLWFWWMGRRLNSYVRRVEDVGGTPHIPGTQDVALMHDNWDGGNDRQLEAMKQAFGMADLNLAAAAPSALAGQLAG